MSVGKGEEENKILLAITENFPPMQQHCGTPPLTCICSFFYYFFFSLLIRKKKHTLKLQAYVTLISGW